jgi:hypothetical protein
LGDGIDIVDAFRLVGVVDSGIQDNGNQEEQPAGRYMKEQIEK